MTPQPEPTDNVVRLNVGGKEGKLTTLGRQPTSPCGCTSAAATT